MPNEITNVLSIHGSEKDIEKLIEFVKSETMIFDFNKIIPMPEELDIEHRIPPTPEQEIIRKENIKKYGFETWYDWRCEKWGTKWNCWSDKNGREESPEPWQNERGIYQIVFNTAWDPPWPIFKQLQELFPTLKLFSLYRDEMWLTDKWELGFGEYTEEEREDRY